MKIIFLAIFFSFLVSCGGGGYSDNSPNSGVVYKNVPEDITPLN
tara:strand:+ start:394 stop:525 length:132 start_codon:yes stop_codon:yes gene_type:complete